MESMAGSILRPLEDAAASLEARLANGEIVSDHGALRTLIRRLEGLARRARGAASQRHYLFDPNALPRDVRNQIIAFARVEAVLRMESCCKNSRDMMRLDDEPAWRRLFGLYFGPAPANTTHWFDMGEKPDFKCIRFFSTPDGWAGAFTGSDIAQRFPDFDEYVANVV